MMNRKWLPLVLVLVLGVVLFFVNRGKDTTSGSDRKKDTGTTVNRNRGFDRRTSYIEYTRHAECRMGCRHISREEVKEIMQEGKINYKKSDVKAKPCPTYALEGITKDDQRVRIVFGQCDYSTRVITVIDLNTDWSCDCPGDDDKYKNQN